MLLVFDFSAAALIRAGSGLVFAILGLGRLMFLPRRQPKTALAWFSFAFGVWLLVENVVKADRDGLNWVLLPLAAVVFPIQFAAIWKLVSYGPSDAAKSARQGLRPWLWATAAGFTVLMAFVLFDGTAYLELTVGDNVPMFSSFVVMSLFLGSLAAVGLLAIHSALVAASPLATTREASNAALLALAFALFMMYYQGLVSVLAVDAPGFAYGTLPALLAILSIAAWYPRSSHPHRRLAASCFAALLAVLIGSLVGSSYWLGGGDNQSDPLGLLGFLRLVGFSLLAYGIFRTDLLGAPIGRIKARAGVLASVGLATLFMAAEIGQNFFSDKYGLYFGGIVGGAAVFAVYPLQRAAERTLEGGPSGKTKRGARAEKYRRLVEMAWKDGQLGPMRGCS